LYETHHTNNPKHFSGNIGELQVLEIKSLVDWAQPDRLLDYGSGKGFQYLKQRRHEQWGGLLPHCYDPGVIQISTKPPGVFGGVICTDVLEHIDADDLDMILADIMSSIAKTGRAFAYFHISTRPAGKTFEDGENVHLTVEPPAWWEQKLQRFVTRSDFRIRATYGD